MASPAKRLDTNVVGDFFVDDTCIDCAACRWIAPASFDKIGDKSRVYHQPHDTTEERRALMALVACPTASIGTAEKHEMEPILSAFPDRLHENVYHCGYHAESSFGAGSYLIVRDGGNILVDSPRYARPLVRHIEELGGVRYMFLTHKDDVADHQKFADHFACKRILHHDDMSAKTRDIEIPLEGIDVIGFADDVTLIPVPGHTKGSTCLLYNDKYLFSGDHLFWRPESNMLYASKRVCWYDYSALKESVKKITQYEFEWLLPGHGAHCHFPKEVMAQKLRECIEAM